MSDMQSIVGAELVSRLAAITSVNGYTFSVSSVGPVTGANRNLSIEIEQDDEPFKDEHADTYDIAFYLHAIVNQPGKTEDAMVDAIKRAVGDDWRGAQWGSASPYVSATGDHAGVTLPLIVTYRISETDPYTSRA